MKTYDSSLVENTGQLTYYTVKTGAQLNHIADQYLIDTDTNNIFDSSLVDYTGQLTYYTVKTSSQSSWTFDSHALIEIENNTLTQALDFTGQLQVTIVKVSSAVLWTGNSINWFYTCIKFIWRRYWSINNHRNRSNTRR